MEKPPEQNMDNYMDIGSLKGFMWLGGSSFLGVESLGVQGQG